MPRLSSILLRGRCIASSLTIRFMPKRSGLTPSERRQVMWAWRRWDARIDSTRVPTTSRFAGAFGRVNSNGQSATSASNKPPCFTNATKNASWPKGVTAASASHSP